MHPNARFHWAERAELRAFVDAVGFGALVMATPDGLRCAHVPAVWLDETRLGIHLARGNALVPHLDGGTALFVVQGPHGYVSPDWYGLPDQVPTWNYVAVELDVVARRLDEAGLMAQVDALSTAREARLAPKPAWTRAKMTPGLAERMAGAIVGFSLDVTDWRGTRKLGQNKAPEVMHRAAEGLAAAGDSALADLMRAAAS